jgi:hypothetical protein
METKTMDVTERRLHSDIQILKGKILLRMNRVPSALEALKEALGLNVHAVEVRLIAFDAEIVKGF